MYLLSWPKTRPLTNPLGDTWHAVIEPGSLTLISPGATLGLTFSNPEELRAFAMQVYAAAIERDQAVQHAAAKASTDRRLARIAAGGPGGLRARLFTETPEPPMHMETA